MKLAIVSCETGARSSSGRPFESLNVWKTRPDAYDVSVESSQARAVSWYCFSKSSSDGEVVAVRRGRHLRRRSLAGQWGRVGGNERCSGGDGGWGERS
jgi:hypothetical protein